MTVATLTILNEDKELIAIEAFSDMEEAAGFALLCNDLGYYPEYGFIEPNLHDDIREVFAMLDSADQLARFLVRLDYDDDVVLKTLREQHPGVDAQAALDQAKAQQVEANARLQEQLDQEAREQEQRR